MKSLLFTPLKIRELILKNRIFMAPMCQYSAVEGVPNEWHHTHLTTRAVGGVGLLIVEATGVEPEGRISKQCLGIYNQEQVNAFKGITKAVKELGASIGIQLAHSGRKGDASFSLKAPSALPFSASYKTPAEMTVQQIEETAEAFLDGAKRALEAGFDVVEIHMAHGYLLHEFLSPYSNHRQDSFGGNLENRMRFPLMVARKIRDFWPAHLPVFVRVSATDWIGEAGWDLPETVVFARELKKIGIDFMDVSTGGNVPDARIPAEPLYQVPFAKKIKQETGLLTGAVGLITESHQAEAVLQNQEADAILLGRILLRDPYWALKAAVSLGDGKVHPHQYDRAF